MFHWNLNSIPAYNVRKLELLQGYISSNKGEMLRLSETFPTHFRPMLHLRINQVVGFY